MIADLNLYYTNSKVKEQRVDGSYFGYNPKLRCPLIAGKSGSKVNYLSKFINLL